MKVTFRAWSQGYTELQSEGDTLYRLDRYNKISYLNATQAQIKGCAVSISRIPTKVDARLLSIRGKLMMGHLR